MNQISNHIAQELHILGEAVIIDVREPLEFREKHIPGALNLPSTQFILNQFHPFADRKICLICESGKRASKIRNKLESSGFTNVFILETQMQNIQVNDHTKGWTVDRQFRLVLGLLLLIYLIMYFLGQNGFIVIPIILSTGLTITAIINRCYMRMAIAKLPWNRGKKE